jgi:hypothetical protein
MNYFDGLIGEYDKMRQTKEDGDMRKLKLACMVLALVCLAVPVRADESEDQKKKGASPQAYEHASDRAIFNRVSDWFATVGKSQQEKEQLLEERKARRAAKRAEREARKAQKKADKESKKTQKELEQEGRKAKEKIREAHEGASDRMRMKGKEKKKGKKR